MPKKKFTISPELGTEEIKRQLEALYREHVRPVAKETDPIFLQWMRRDRMHYEVHLKPDAHQCRHELTISVNKDARPQMFKALKAYFDPIFLPNEGMRIWINIRMQRIDLYLNKEGGTYSWRPVNTVAEMAIETFRNLMDQDAREICGGDEPAPRPPVPTPEPGRQEEESEFAQQQAV
jgi:hypothetical protein